MKLPTLYYKNKKGHTHGFKIYTDTEGYTTYDYPMQGGKVKEFHYKTYPYTKENIEECALVEWNRLRIGKGYVRLIGDWDKYSYIERVERG